MGDRPIFNQVSIDSLSQEELDLAGDMNAQIVLCSKENPGFCAILKKSSSNSKWWCESSLFPTLHPGDFCIIANREEEKTNDE